MPAQRENANACNEMLRYFIDVHKWDVKQHGGEIDASWPGYVKVGGSNVTVQSAMVNARYTLKKLKSLCEASTAPFRIPYLNISDGHTVWLYEKHLQKKQNRGKKRDLSGENLGSSLVQLEVAKRMKRQSEPENRVEEFEPADVVAEFPVEVQNETNLKKLIKFSKYDFKKQLKNDSTYPKSVRRAISRVVLYRYYIVKVKGLAEPHWDKHKIASLTGWSPDNVKPHKGSFFLGLFHSSDMKANQAAINRGFRKQAMEGGKKVYGDAKFARLNRSKIVEHLKADSGAFDDKWLKHLQKIFSQFWSDVSAQVEKEVSE